MRPELAETVCAIGVEDPEFVSAIGWLNIVRTVRLPRCTYLCVLMRDQIPVIQPFQFIAAGSYQSIRSDGQTEPLSSTDRTYRTCAEIRSIVHNARIGRLFVYYGAADQVIGVASVEMEKLMKAFFRPA